MIRGVEMSHERDLILKEEVHRIVGCGMEVLNVLGHGFLEKTKEPRIDANERQWFVLIAKSE